MSETQQTPETETTADAPEAPAPAAAAAPAPAAAPADEFVYQEPTYSFNVEVAGEIQEFGERADAVSFAKSATDGNERTAFLVRSDERLRMQFREGSLFDYVLETRKGRRL